MVALVFLLVAGAIWMVGLALAQRKEAEQIRLRQVAPQAASLSPSEIVRRKKAQIRVVATILGAFGLFMLFQFFGASLILSLAGSLGGLMMPNWWLEYQQTKTMIQTSEQLDQAMGLILASLRQSVPLEMAFVQAASKLEAPLGPVLEQVGTAASVGMQFGAALQAARTHPAVAENPDFQVFVTDLIVAYERGGSLTETFDTLRNIVAERRRFRGAVKEQMGQHVFQTVAIIGVGALALVFYVLSSASGLKPLLKTGIGQIVLLVSVLGCLAMARTTHVAVLQQLRKV